MLIVINHVTRMAPGFVCVAGIDLDTRRHVRPILPESRRLGIGAVIYGPMTVGSVVDIGDVKANGGPPEVEDAVFDLRLARRIREDPHLMWAAMTEVSGTNVRALLGQDLEVLRRGAFLPEGGGSASLACLDASLTRISTDGSRIRATLEADGVPFDLPVTDLSHFEVHPDAYRPSGIVIQSTMARLRAGARPILAIGVGRPFSPDGNSPPVHWLQVNGIHFQPD